MEVANPGSLVGSDPLPTNLAAAWQEWSRLHGRGATSPEIAERLKRLERLLLCELPARDGEELRYRILVLRERLLEAADEGVARAGAALLADFDRLLGTREPQPEGKPSATDRRQEVVALLMDPEKCRWSNREIARQVGVSPQTVGNWRKKLSDGAAEETSPERVVRRGKSAYEMNIGSIGRARPKPVQQPPKPAGFITLAQAIREYFEKHHDPEVLARTLREASIATDQRLRRWRDADGQIQILYPVSVVESCARRYVERSFRRT